MQLKYMYCNLIFYNFEEHGENEAILTHRRLYFFLVKGAFMKLKTSFAYKMNNIADRIKIVLSVKLVKFGVTKILWTNFELNLITFLIRQPRNSDKAMERNPKIEKKLMGNTQYRDRLTGLNLSLHNQK